MAHPLNLTVHMRANNAAQLSTGCGEKPWQHAARGLTGCQCQWMEYLGPVDSSSLPVRLRWKLCRAALHHLPPPSALPPGGFLVCFASQKSKQKSFPPKFSSSSFPLSRLRDRKRWLARAPGTRVTLSPTTAPRHCQRQHRRRRCSGAPSSPGGVGTNR